MSAGFELLYAPTYRLVALGINKLNRFGHVVEFRLYTEKQRNKYSGII